MGRIGFCRQERPCTGDLLRTRPDADVGVAVWRVGLGVGVAGWGGV